MNYLLYYTPRTQALKDALPKARRVSLEETERQIRIDPRGPGTEDNGDNSRSAFFDDGMSFIVYVISGDEIEIRVIGLMAP